MEKARKTGIIGSTLEVSMTLYADEPLRALLQKIGEELRFILMTSETIVRPIDHQHHAETTALDSLRIAIAPSSYTKCIRCWHRCQDIGSHTKHPKICQRCIQNVEGTGEQRYFA